MSEITPGRCPYCGAEYTLADGGCSARCQPMQQHHAQVDAAAHADVTEQDELVMQPRPSAALVYQFSSCRDCGAILKQPAPATVDQQIAAYVRAAFENPDVAINGADLVDTLARLIADGEIWIDHTDGDYCPETNAAHRPRVYPDPPPYVGPRDHIGSKVPGERY